MKVPTSETSNKMSVRDPVGGTVHEFGYVQGNSASMEVAKRKRDQAANDILTNIRQRIGRDPTVIESSRGYIESKFDSRTTAEQQSDAEFTVRVRTEISPEEKEALEAEARLEAVREAEQVRKMSREERLAHFARERADRTLEESDGDKVKAAHLKKYGDKIEFVQGLLNDERWSTNSDAGYRATLDQALQCLKEPQGCPLQRNNLLKKIDTRLQENRKAKLTELAKQRVELEAQLAATNEEVSTLADPEISTEQGEQV